jgi:hypothetical protein
MKISAHEVGENLLKSEQMKIRLGVVGFAEHRGEQKSSKELLKEGTQTFI